MMSTAQDSSATKTVHKAVEHISSIVKNGSNALTQGNDAAQLGFQNLAKAYQDIATKNYERQVASIKELTSVKSPIEFFQVQQRLVKDSYESAVADGKNIAELTASAFSATFDPVKKQIEALQEPLKN